MIKALNTFFAFLILFFSVGCGSQETKLTKETRFLMGTLFDITVSHPDVEKAQKSIEKAFNEIKRVEFLTSKFISTSEAEKINQLAFGRGYSVSKELYKLLRQAVNYSVITNGAFDITIGVIQDAWNFENNKEKIPSAETIRDLLPLVGYKNILFEKDFDVRFKKAGMKIDLGAIAKGYAVDRGIEILKNDNIYNAILNGGGDLKCIGEKNAGSPWRVGIRHPRNQSAIVSSLECKDIAMATSGDYQNYFIKEGLRYHHILDPKTGIPAKGPQSATILTEKAVMADAMATAVFVMNDKKRIKFIESQNQLEGVIITSEGKKIISSGLKGKIDIDENN